MTIPRWSNVRLNGVGEQIAAIAEFYPGKGQIYITSGLDGDHGASSYHYGHLNYGGSAAAAVDFGFGGTGDPGAGYALARWWYQFTPDLVELIHSSPISPGGFYVKNQQHVGPYAAAAHYNHVHVATSAKLAGVILARLRPSPTPAPAAPKENVMFVKVKGNAATYISDGFRYRLMHDGAALGKATRAGYPVLEFDNLAQLQDAAGQPAS